MIDVSDMLVELNFGLWKRFGENVCQKNELVILLLNRHEGYTDQMFLFPSSLTNIFHMFSNSERKDNDIL